MLRIVLVITAFFTSFSSLYAGAYVNQICSNDSVCELTINVPSIDVDLTNNSVFGHKAIEVKCQELPHTAVVYKPQLPYIPLSLIIPFGKEIDSVSISTGGKRIVSFVYPLYYKPHGKNGEALDEFDGAKEFYFQTDTATFEHITTQVSSGVNVAYFNFYPVQYRAEIGRLVMYEKAVVSFTFRNSIDQRNPVVGDISEFDNTSYVNGDQLKTYQCNAPRGRCDLLILSTEEFFSYNGKWSIGKLQELRERQGLTVERVSLSEIISAAHGVDAPQKIRNYLREVYQEKGISYLLIIGDHSQIPARILTPNSNPLWGAKAENIASDLYYQCLDGNYNSNGDEHWGDRYDANVDIMPEFSIGRAPVESVEELENFIFKTITHESQSSCEDALIAAEPLGLKGISSTEHMEEIAQGASSNKYVTKGFNSLPATIVTTKYGELKEWAKTDVIEWINSDQFTLINHLGHGYYNWVMLLKNGDEAQFINKKLPFLYTQACLSGKFNSDCIAERLLTSNRFGFWGAVMNSATGKINGEKKGPSQYLNRFFWDAWFSKSKKRVGDMNRYSHEMCVPMKNATDMVHCIYSSNLLADPSAPILGSGVTNTVNVKEVNSQQLIISKKKNSLSISGAHDFVGGNLALYSIQGRRVMQSVVPQSGVVTTTSIASGIYLVTLKQGNQSLAERIKI